MAFVIVQHMDTRENDTCLWLSRNIACSYASAGSAGAGVTSRENSIDSGILVRGIAERGLRGAVEIDSERRVLVAVPARH